VKLKCDVFGGRPTPNVTWYRDGYPLSSEAFLVPSGRHLRSEIVVERLSRQDLNSRFTCKAINHHRATPVEVSVQLDMNCKFFLLVDCIPFFCPFYGQNLDTAIL
jgi:immunoglobulin superfamily member 9B